MTTELTGVIAEHIAAVNAFDVDRIMATFAVDAYVNDNHREIWGPERIRQFFTREFVGDHVTMDVTEVVDHHGDVIVRARYDGTYDKTNLPEELIMSSYFSLRNDAIISLTIIHNKGTVLHIADYFEIKQVFTILNEHFSGTIDLYEQDVNHRITRRCS